MRNAWCSVLILLLPGLAAGQSWLVGGGVESDSSDGLQLSGFGSVALADSTWLSATLASSSFDLPTGRDSETGQWSLDLDHHFDPLGVRVGLAYWGDDEVLESADWNASVYFRNDALTLAAEYEFRDFDFTIPATDFFPGRTIRFDADGIGASARVRLNEWASLSAGGTHYDYSVDFQPTRDRDIVGLVSVSRLSLINSLVDERGWLTLGFDHGLRRFEIDFATQTGAIDGVRTRSATLRYLFPIGTRADLEFGIGQDRSDEYGDVTFFSVFLYFYGGS